MVVSFRNLELCYDFYRLIYLCPERLHSKKNTMSISQLQFADTVLGI